MSSLLSADLAAACSALGYFDKKTNKYYADSNTLETVKDLIRYLRRDDETHDIRRQLGDTKVLQTDLLLLLKSYWEETDLFDVLLRLIVNLTTPALMLWNEEIPTEKIVRNYYLQVEGHLQSYKEAFADESVWAVLSTRLSKILEIEPAERGDENSLIIERILILIRNVLYVPADALEKRPDNDASVHDQVLWALHQSGMLDIILYITSSPNEQAYYMHILEILSFMFREQKASELASAALQRSQTEKIRDEAELLAIRHRETLHKQIKMKKYTGARHSRFGGTYVVKSMKSISDNDLIYHKPLDKVEELNFDIDKTKPKTPKNRLPVVGTSSERRSAFSIRLFLKEFCVEFLNAAYNTMMYYVKDNLVRERAQPHDESYYLWALRFFMEFNRCYKFEVKLVSETMSVQTFHYVQQQSEKFYDMLTTDKKKLTLWSRRLHLALLAYRELFFTLLAMDKSPDGTVRDSSKVIKSNIFYVPEYREFILVLLINYDELKMSDTYLKDLIETQHVFLKMLERFCADDGSIMVQQRQRRKKKKNKKSAPAVIRSSQPPELNLEGAWDEAAPQLSAVLGGGELRAVPDVVPFDAASDVPIDDQKSEAMKNIQRRLRDGNYEEAVALLRAAREVWPENDSFGGNNMAPEEEFLAFRDIFFADLGENVPKTLPEMPSQEDDFGGDDEDDEEEGPQYNESDFKFEDFSKRLTHPKIVRACGLALRDFDKNPVNTNLCIVKLLHRIAFDCKMYVMVFQLSIFRTFQRIFSLKDLPQHKELVKFATYIVRQFIKVSEVNKKVFMEALFWKTSSEAYDIEFGYGSCSQKPSARAWSEEEEDELRRLFMEHQQSNSKEDVVDWIVNNLIDNTRSRRMVLKKLKEMYLITDYKGKKKSGVRSRPPTNWSEEEEMQLQELYEEFRNASDPLGCIMSRLDVQRPRNRIVEKMLVIGLIQDKKEVRKKRGAGNKSQARDRRNSTNDSVSEISDSDRSEDDARRISNIPPSTSASRPAKKKTKKSSSTGNKRKTSHVTISTKQLSRMLVGVMNSGLDQALEWLKESLSDAIEDFGDGDNEGIPLVPVMDYAETAMENAEFQQILKAFGICEPFDEQEAYWRIPGHLTIATLTNYCDLIQQALDKTLHITEELENTDISSNNTQPNDYYQNNESSDDEDVFEKLRGRTNKSEKNENSNYIRDENASNDDVFENLGASTSRLQDNDAPNDEEKLASSATNKQTPTAVTKKVVPLKSAIELQEDENESNNSKNETAAVQKTITFDSDSDEEVTKLSSDNGDSKRDRSSSSSDAEKPVTKRARVLLSDDSE